MANEQNLKPFKKGEDSRRNRKGRPKSFDALRALAKQLAHETVTVKNGKELVEITTVEAILRQWAADKKHQKDFMEYAFGKVPDVQEHTGKDGATIKVTILKEDD